jgi:hypothetical protein
MEWGDEMVEEWGRVAVIYSCVCLLLEHSVSRTPAINTRKDERANAAHRQYSQPP